MLHWWILNDFIPAVCLKTRGLKQSHAVHGMLVLMIFFLYLCVFDSYSMSPATTTDRSTQPFFYFKIKTKVYCYIILKEHSDISTASHFSHDLTYSISPQSAPSGSCLLKKKTSNVHTLSRWNARVSSDHPLKFFDDEESDNFWSLEDL